MTNKQDIKELQNKIAVANGKINNKSTHINDSTTKVIRDTNDTNDINDTNKGSIKSIKSIKSIVVSLKEYSGFFNKLGKKEYVCWYLFDKIKSPSEVDKELKLPKQTTKLIINRNQNLFELDHKEEQTKFWKLSPDGIKLVESKIQEYEKTKKRAEEVADEVVKETKEKETKEEEFTESLEQAKDFLEKQKLIKPDIEVIDLDVNELNSFYPDLVEKLLEEPEEILEIFEVAKNQFDIKDVENIEIRLINLPKSSKIKLSKINTKYVNKLFYTDCIVKIDRDNIHIALSAKFECPACGNDISILQLDPSNFKEPNRCSCGMKGKFRLLDREMTDKKEIVLEEFLEETKQRSMKGVCTKRFITDPKVSNKLVPGIKIEVIGIIKEEPIKTKMGKVTSEYKPYLEILNIKFLEDIDIDVFSKEEIIEFKKIADENNRKGLKKLITSFAPNIVYSRDLKEGIICQAVTAKSSEERGRKTVHMMLIGATAVAKTSLFTWTENNIFRCLSASENSSSAGLTVGLIRDEFFNTGNFIASPGLLPKANNSIAIIDEMDKIEEDKRTNLHSAMSKGYVKETKIKNAKLPADTNILAGCNPFSTNPFKQHAQENWSNRFNVPKSFINRFDLVFEVKDEVDVVKDTEISDAMYKQSEGIKPTKLKCYNKLTVKKFLLFIKQQPEPTISQKIDKINKDCFLLFRETFGPGCDIPITPRLKETITNISKCQAKLRLNKIVEKKDIERTINLILKTYERNKIVTPADFKKNIKDIIGDGKK